MRNSLSSFAPLAYKRPCLRQFGESRLPRNRYPIQVRYRTAPRPEILSYQTSPVGSPEAIPLTPKPRANGEGRAERTRVPRSGERVSSTPFRCARHARAVRGLAGRKARAAQPRALHSANRTAPRPVVYVLQQLNPTWPPREKAGCARKRRSASHYHLLSLGFPPFETTSNIVASSACW